MSHQPRKRFGQNFLQDKQIIQHILSALRPQPEDKLIEIGPGLGALTAGLLKYGKQLIAIEIDSDLSKHLQEHFAGLSSLTLLNADALQVDYSQWGKDLRIVGNLAYNIATPLLFHLLNYRHFIADMHFMLQKEVALRLIAKPGSKAYGRLAIMLQYACEIELLFEVPPTAFYPQPKVDSAIVRLIPHSQSPYPPVNSKVLEQVVAQSFAMRRKTLANNLKAHWSAAQLQNLGIDLQQRPEQIAIIDYVRIANSLAS